METPNTVSEQLLELLQCPKGGASLVQQGDDLVCERCGLRFPVRNGIPALVMDQAILPVGVNHLDELACSDNGE